MANSEQLRKNKNQHIVKNRESKKDDINIKNASNKVIEYLNEKFKEELKNYEIVYKKEIKIKYMIDFIKEKNLRKEFDLNYINREIRPDGGSLFLQDKINKKMKPLLISETKKQGTNKKRIEQGHKKQAIGNAIERLGKNLIGIKAMLNHYDITPFVCFGWGDDFSEKEKTALVKVSVLNEFYSLNKIFIFKRDGSSNYNKYSPVSMFFQEKRWTEDEMFKIMKEIAETSLRFYLY